MSARDLLNHPWLKEPDEYNVWMSKEHLKEFKIVNHKQFPGFLDKLRQEKAEQLNEQQQEEEKKVESDSSSSSSGSEASSINLRDAEN